MNEEELKLRNEAYELRDEIKALKALIDGDIPAGVSRLMSKVDRQRAALDKLHTRVVNQRFHLRTLNELGRGLTKEEYEVARDRVENDQVKDRLVGVDA